MSGGVDSSVAAYILKKQGYNVIGMFMKNWEEKDDQGVCPAVLDYEDVVRVCNQIEIPYYSVNFSNQYWDQVFEHCLEEFKAGFTPNPDVLCNREIKFKVLLEKAKEIGGDFLATGHYCRVGVEGGSHALLKGIDPSKDQSYFLYMIKAEQLAQVLFPVGELNKSDVRTIAKKLGLATAEKKDSTGLCFIGERKFKNFLSTFLPFQPGDMVTGSGEIVGRHDGIAFYTIGQRKGLGIGGRGDAWYVIGKDVARNILLVEQGENHPSLFSNGLNVKNLSWISAEEPIAPLHCFAKIRYRQVEQPCIVTKIENDSARVDFPTPQRAVTPGQSIVFYQGDQCLGGGIIQETRDARD